MITAVALGLAGLLGLTGCQGEDDFVESPAPGLWRGSVIAFNVSGDGSELTPIGSPITTPPEEGPVRAAALKIGPVPISGGGVDATVTTYFMEDFPIREGHFSIRADNGTSVEGEFVTTTQCGGSYNVVVELKDKGTYQSTGSWSAVASGGMAAARLAGGRIVLETDAELTVIQRY